MHSKPVESDLDLDIAHSYHSSFTMLHVVTFTLALMAIGATAQTLDSLKTAGCVDQSVDFIEKLPGPLTDCAQVASSGSCTDTDTSP